MCCCHRMQNDISYQLAYTDFTTFKMTATGQAWLTTDYVNPRECPSYAYYMPSVQALH